MSDQRFGEHYSRIFITIIVTLLFSFSIAFADNDFTPVYHPTLEISKLDGEIKVDGELNDSGWKTSAKATNFAEHSPGDQTKPPVNTEAIITYDESKLYIAMICYDDPSLVRATLCERDRGIYNDDNICILLDTYCDASWAYEFNVNPYGIQADAIWSENGGEDNSYDMVWESAGKITDSGYQIEAAIPFSSLRFPNKDEQVWRMDFWRNHPREVRAQYSWAAYDRDEPCWPCKWGTVTGIKNVKPGKGIEILPSFIGFKAGALSGEGTSASPYDFIDEKADGEFSLGAKYAVSSNITVEATYNPDYSQVEADATQIDVNTNIALSLQEKRPFFQEGRDLFSTIFNAVYTRSINNPEYAAKVTARLDKTSIAYMLAQDENTPLILPFEEHSIELDDGAGKSVSNILRVRHIIGENSHIGMLFTDRRLDVGGSNTLFSVDGKFRLSKKYSFDFQGLATQTTESNDIYLRNQYEGLKYLTDDTLILNDPSISDTLKYDTIKFDNDRHTAVLDGEKFWGHAYWLGIERETANSYMNITYLEKNPRYRADVGFQPSNNMRSIRSFGLYHFRFDSGLFERLSPSYKIGHQKNFVNNTKDQFVEFALEGTLRFAQTSFHAMGRKQTEMYGGVEFDNAWIIHNCFNMKPSALLSLGAGLSYGNAIYRGSDPLMGRETSGHFWIDIKPIDRLLIENSYNYYKLSAKTRLRKGYTFRTRWNLQLSKGLTFRLVGQYNDFSKSYDLDPLLTYRINPFSIFYIGSTFDYSEFDVYNDDEQEEFVSSSSRLASRQFFMKLQYLFQL